MIPQSLRDSSLEEGAKGSGFNIRSFSFENYSADLLYEGDKRVETEIESSFTTKIFAFGAPHIRKNIEQVNLQVGNNGGNMIKVFTVIFEVPDDYNLLTYGDVGLAIYNGLSSQMPKTLSQPLSQAWSYTCSVSRVYPQPTVLNSVSQA